MKDLCVALLLVMLAAPASAEPRSQLIGEWWTPGFNARVRIQACGDAVCGHIVWLWDEQARGVVDRGPLIGKAVIDGMRATEPLRWSGGRLYNPEDGRDYKGSLQLRSPSSLLVDGCVLFICQTQVWRKFDASRSPPVAP